MEFNSETADLLDRYVDKLNTVTISPLLFIIFLGVLVAAFVIRFVLLYNVEKNRPSKKASNKKISSYLLWHMLIELFIALVPGVLLIVLTYAKLNNYIVNYILAPAIGMIAAVYLDNKVVIPLESATGLGDKLWDKKHGNPVTQSDAANVSSTVPEKASKDGYLPDNLADSENFESEVIKAINEVKQENAAQNEVIAENSAKLDNTVECLAKLKEAEMLGKKIELKSMIYACINKGYVTPEEHDKVTTFYHTYKSLGGNHEVESLYNNHFSKLPIHTTRTTPVALSHILVEYGQYDNE